MKWRTIIYSASCIIFAIGLLLPAAVRGAVLFDNRTDEAPSSGDDMDPPYSTGTTPHVGFDQEDIDDGGSAAPPSTTATATTGSTATTASTEVVTNSTTTTIINYSDKDFYYYDGSNGTVNAGNENNVSHAPLDEDDGVPLPSSQFSDVCADHTGMSVCGLKQNSRIAV